VCESIHFCAIHGDHIISRGLAWYADTCVHVVLSLGPPVCGWFTVYCRSCPIHLIIHLWAGASVCKYHRVTIDWFSWSRLVLVLVGLD
jgi:hypothetical protein